MKRFSESSYVYEDEAYQQLQKYENLIEGYIDEYKKLVELLKRLKEEDKTKTISYKEAFSRKLFLVYLLKQLSAIDFIEVEDFI